MSYKDRKAQEEEIRKWSIVTNKLKLSYKNRSNCIELYEAWEENGYLYSSSEYCENGNLTQWLKARALQMTKREIYKFIYDMALAVKQVHDCNIVHMDIKPDNFLVKADNSLKLGDFGLAVSLDDLVEPTLGDLKGAERLKAKDISEGDASYLAPELLSFKAKITKKVDVFSFGISLIECFNCDGITKLPKNGELWTKVRHEQPSSFIKFPFTDLSELIDHMTQFEVEKRFTIEDVLNNKNVAKFDPDHQNSPSKEEKVNL